MYIYVHMYGSDLNMQHYLMSAPANLIYICIYTYIYVCVGVCIYTQHSTLNRMHESFFFCITLDTGPRRPLRLDFSDTYVYGPNPPAPLWIDV